MGTAASSVLGPTGDGERMPPSRSPRPCRRGCGRRAGGGGSVAGWTAALLLGAGLGEAEGEDDVALRSDLGNLTFPMAARSAAVLDYFNQGYRFLSAADRPRAASSFRRSQEGDPSCGLCFWGEALALGPGLDSFDSPSALSAVPAALALARRAAALLAQPSQGANTLEARDELLALALVLRYGGGGGDAGSAAVAPQASQMRQLDLAYADAMQDVAERFPDCHVRALAAEAWLLTMRWDHWQVGGSSGSTSRPPTTDVGEVDPLDVAAQAAAPGSNLEPSPATSSALRLLRTARSQCPSHVGILRLFVHAMDGGPLSDGDRSALRQAAEVLETAMSGAPHPMYVAGRCRGLGITRRPLLT